MIKLISKTDGKTAVTLLILGAVLLLAIFMIPIMRVDAAHCTNTTVTPCTEDIRNTKHNLNENTDIGPITGTTEVCIFCHTPHGARSTIGSAPTGQAPLWNRAIKVTTNYQMYSSPNFDAVDATGGPKGVSLACLSCHDGTISFDSLINPPGSGGFIPGNLTDTSGSGTSMGMTFGGPGVDGTNSMNETTRGQDLAGGFAAGTTTPGGQDRVYDGTGGGLGMNPYPNLTQDLRDDHPISMRMPSTDPQFNDALNNSDFDGGTEGLNVRFVSRYASGSRIWSTDKRDRIRLYPSATGDSDFVECASCHNPHTPRPLFLRLPTINGGSVGTEFPTGANFTGGGFGTILINSLGGPVFNGATSVSPNDLAHNPNQGSLVCLSCHHK
ncbi:MAG: hypothetical protein HZA12_04305 [Nitrospirae bacterium]|nr:hypothetical protein [Nitrospirota bacterium]